MYGARINIDISAWDDLEELSDDLINDLVVACEIHDIRVEDICIDFE
ncbi:hypothetical protein [Holdemanella porci]